MKIKRLEIIGFKSFVDKMVFDFPQGITAVVGPNGCGKSNIVDAIRWVMGEQSAKNLRGKSMEDLIFGGSESRKPLGMAEVTLTFSAEDGRVPAKYLSYSEIQVTRRLYRDGESEYLLNKTSCRLMDIAELFMDTGVGARAYSIIEQGRIGMILMSKPEERRFLIEEAAGVTKYKSRKQVALKKIEHSRQNLLRIGDIIAELKRQLNSLQRQAKKAEKFRAFREELKEIEVTLAAMNFASLERERAALVAELADLEMKAAAVAGDLESRDLAMEEKRIALLELEKNLSAAQEETYRLRGEIQGTENRLEFRKKELLNLDHQRQRLTEELTNLAKQQTDSGEELAILEDRQGAYGAELAAAEDALGAGEKDLEEQAGVERELGMRLDGTRRELFSLLTEIAQLSNQQTGIARRLEAIEERFERNRRETHAFREALAAAEKRASDLLAEVGSQTERKGAVIESLAASCSREENLKVTLDLLERELMTCRDELSRKKSRLHSLQELEAQFAGYGQGVRSIFLADSFKGRFPGVVADMLEVEDAYELALEAALGEKLQYVACAGEEEAVAAVSYLKQTSGGRCSLLPKDVRPPAQHQPLAGVARLLDKVTVRDGWREAIGLLLAEFYLADNLPAALALARRHPQLAFVTPGGEVAGWGGIVNGGSTEVAQQGLVHKKREVKDLARAVTQAETVLQGKELEREALKAAIGRAEEEVRGIRQQMHEAELRLVTTGNDLQRVREECRGLEERIALKGLENDQFCEEKDALLSEMVHAGEKRRAGEERKEEVEADVARLEKALATRKAEIDRLREGVTQLKVKAAALREKGESNLRAIKRVQELASDLRARCEGHGVDLERCGEAFRGLATEIVGDEELLGKLLARQVEAESAFAAVRTRYDSEALALQEEEAGIRGIRTCGEEIRQALAARTLRNSELAMTLQNLENSLMDKYRLSIATCLPATGAEGLDHAAMQERRAELQKIIDEMGDVNLMAIEEYRELEERFEFLSGQKADLEESLHSLQKAIQRINKTTRKRFLETFHLVNDKFKEVFPRLFCGGRAELKLTNEEDLLETGIDIIVQPPGKKLQNVTLLSGGEKALTAVALIFSIFLIKPSPFCLLDEVDAPLDDANIGRFNELVREMTSFSQFIIITHNKATMAVADTLFGVTMEEPGVSKLVSVRLN